MAHRTMPILYLNLCGEMLYIIDQRLIDTNTAHDAQSKVCNDILQVAFNRKFINEIFTNHQPLYSKTVMKAMFERLARASTIRVNSESLDKMYELMIMAVKHQIFAIRNPRHLTMVTLNHLDAMQDYTCNTETRKSIRLAHEFLINGYANLSVGQLQSIRYAILNFLQDIQVRVSVLLQNGFQYQNGSFKFSPAESCYKGVDKPGQIIYFDSKGEVMDTTSFNPGIVFKDPEPEGTVGLHEIGCRGTQLGMNMYAAGKLEDHPHHTSQAKGASKYISATEEPSPDELFPKMKRKESNKCAQAELNLLAKLIGTNELSFDQNNSKEAIRINLFDHDPEHPVEEPQVKVEKSTKKASVGTLEFDLKTVGRKRDEHIEKLVGELNIKDDNEEVGDEDDLLALMDKAT